MRVVIFVISGVGCSKVDNCFCFEVLRFLSFVFDLFTCVIFVVVVLVVVCCGLFFLLLSSLSR